MAETDVRSNRCSVQMGYVHCFADKVKRFPGLAGRETWKVGKEDPRRVVHSFKVGIALTLVSLLYLMEPLFNGIGQNAMWAVMTVVVVMEFTVGATLSKGLNRGLGTLLAASLAFLTEYIADAPGRIFRAVFIAIAVFIIGTMTSYVRFIPYIKKNYDYGVLIFLLTFNLITVSSYRIDDVWSIAEDRISTIAIGCAICLVMSILVFPNWSGEDLHNNTISRLEGLANCIQVCVREYFNDSEESTCQDDSSEDPIYKGYKAVLDSKTTDETLALQASWEPRYLRYCHRIPWHQYAKVGAALRYFSYTVVALHGCLQSEIQTPKSIRALYKDSCIRLGEEVSKVLRELANSIRNNRQFSPEMLSNNLNAALQDLNSALKSQPQLVLGSRNSRAINTPIQAVQHHDQKLEEDTRTSLPSVKNIGSSSRLGCRSREHSRELTKKVLRTQLSKAAIVSLEFSEALPFAAFTSLLVEMVAKLDRVMDEVEDLGRMAYFREFEDVENGDKIVVTCEKPKTDIAQNGVPSAGSE
ncbi:aluminum-activated malate transporter 12-like [Vigna umbellata]|uniref:aluminum-activated malate transporter 12-like n=1 Tax=Vigna umbellata TaxID=87088 RepID=UPI001F5F0E9E|nr:aluminum-activated malate transporter 12-like [Vigna umbellata]XP_047179716.1 aluminum-activated malate transporter 12-like [Vigna umbellata]